MSIYSPGEVKKRMKGVESRSPQLWLDGAKMDMLEVLTVIAESQMEK